MPRFTLFSLALIAAVFTPATAVRAESAERAELESLRAQVRLLQEQLEALTRRIDAREGARPTAAAAAETTSAPAANRARGFTLTTADDDSSIRLRGLVQLDHRLFFDDGGLDNNAFVLRRARIISEGTLAGQFGFQLVPEFAGSNVSILDANITWKPASSLQLKLGKFKMPVAHEQLQSDSWTFFNERSIVTNLAPGRDLGIQLGGELFDRRATYAVGVFNGVGDGATSNNSDFDEDKDLAGRVFFLPFRKDTESAARGFGFGIGGSFGRQKGAGARTAGYRTDGQQTFFAYLPSVVGDGKIWRVSPHVDFRRGPLGLLGEYTVSTANLRPSAGAPKAEIQHRGWQFAGGYVLTGEDSGLDGVTPRADFDLAAGTLGAFELVGRYAKVDVDDAVFPTFAAPGAAASAATSLGFGFNWYLNRAAMLKLDYYQTDFDFNAAAPATSTAPVLRQDEKVFTTRLQLTF